MTKHRFLLIFSGLLVAGFAFTMQQTNALKVTRYTWESSRVPPGFDGYLIVQVSDLHGKRFGMDQKRLLKVIRDLNPDMIAFTGDMISLDTKDLSPVQELLAGLAGLAPMYYVDGNHDPLSPAYMDFRALLRECGVVTLEGCVALARGSDAMVLAGYGYWTADRVAEPADIVLYHSPHLFDALHGESVGLILAGHIHGGQVALPGGRAILGPGGALFPDYAGGFYERGGGGTAMVVSKGLGNSGLPVRLFARPEVLCVTLSNCNV